MKKTDKEIVQEIYRKFVKQNENAVFDLIIAAYGAGYNECVNENNLLFKLKTLTTPSGE
jgi:hypothetical protein